MGRKALGRVGDKDDDLPLFRTREDASAGIGIFDPGNEPLIDA